MGGLGPLDGGRLGIVWQPADSGQHSGLIGCHPGSLLVQCELRRAVGWLQQSIPSTSFSSSPPPVTEFKFDIRQYEIPARQQELPHAGRMGLSTCWAHKFTASWTHELRGAFKRRTFQEENLSMKRSLDEIYPFYSIKL